QPRTGRLDGVHLVVELAVQIESLIRADHQAFPAGRDGDRFGFGQRASDFLRPRALGQQGALDRILVDAGARRRERHAGAAQNGGAGRALRSERQLHPRISTWPWPLWNRLSTAAAVSSTLRRETSITGQPWRS